MQDLQWFSSNTRVEFCLVGWKKTYALEFVVLFYFSIVSIYIRSYKCNFMYIHYDGINNMYMYKFTNI